MKKSLAIIIVLILIILGAGVWWFYFGRGGGYELLYDLGGKKGAPEEEEQSFVGKIADALKLGKTLKCTWSKEGDTTTFYIKGKKYYVEGTSPISGKVNYILFRDNCTYFWQKDEKQGFKLCWTSAEAEEMMSEFGKGAPEAAATFGYEYNCQPAVVSDSLFTLPSEIDFMYLSE